LTAVRCSRADSHCELQSLKYPLLSLLGDNSARISSLVHRSNIRSITMRLTHAPLHGAIGVAALLAAALFGLGAPRAAESAKGNSNEMTRQELERRPIPGTDLEMRLNLVTQPPGYSEPVHHHPGPSFVYMLEGTAESAYGEEDIKRLHPGDHWSQPIDVPHRVARNPDPKVPRRFLVFTVNRPGEPSAVVP
jgi:quercetin dioxygenase-like cupin family protein